MLWIFLAFGAAVVFAFSAYEVYALANAEPGDTISEYFWYVSRDYPILPFMVGLVAGVLAGHLWWQRPL